MSIREAQVRFYRACASLIFVACTGHGADSGPAIPDTPPTITAASVSCDPEAGVWSFDVQTDAWTGNGQVLLSEDGAYVERHTMYSASAAPDGTSDHLELDLVVVPDWRDVTPGASTAFNCQSSDLTGIVRVWTRDGASEADCRSFGVAPERWETWSAGASCVTSLDR